MTNIILGFTIAAASLTACNNNAADTKKSEVKNDTPVTVAEQNAPDTTIAPATVTFPVKEIITGYLNLKNALAKDNGKNEATAGNAIVATLATVNMKSFLAEQMKGYMDIADDLKEHAEHIGAEGLHQLPLAQLLQPLHRVLRARIVDLPFRPRAVCLCCSHTSSRKGFSTIALKLARSSAPSAPSTTRWSQESVAVIRLIKAIPPPSSSTG